MKKSITFLFVFFIFLQTAFSQDFVFRVMVSKGSIQAKKGTNLTEIKTGYKFQANDEVQVGDNSFLGLMHKNGRTLEVKTPGTYKISDLAAKLAGVNNSIANRIGNTIASQLAVNNSGGNTKVVTGSGERSLEKKDIILFIPHDTTCNFHGDKLSLSWYAFQSKPDYVVTVKNMFGETLFRSTILKDTSLVLDMTQPKIKAETNGEYLILIQAKTKPEAKNFDKKSSEYNFLRLKEPVRVQVEKDLAAMQPESGNSSLQQIVLASYFDSKFLFLDAMQAYEKAIALEPEVDDYKVLYQEFKTRHGMLKTKKK
jgi:hypothetical protein